jgi:hypothetical protein
LIGSFFSSSALYVAYIWISFVLENSKKGIMERLTLSRKDPRVSLRDWEGQLSLEDSCILAQDSTFLKPALGIGSGTRYMTN